MTTSNDDAVREVARQQRAERRNKTSTPRNDKPTSADLTRELHLMETQVREHGFPGTRAVLDLIGELRKEVYALKTALRDAQPYVARCNHHEGDNDTRRLLLRIAKLDR